MKKTIVTIGLLLMVVTVHAVDLSDKDKAKFAAAVKAYQMNQNANALRLFTELYKDYPQNQQIQNNYAVVLFADGKIEKAEEMLSGVIENNKQVSVVFKNLNKIYDYAAAKAYSNALGNEKEVVPQKLQLIESLPPPETVLTMATSDKSPLKTGSTSIKNIVDPKPASVNVVLPTAALSPTTKPVTPEAPKPELAQGNPAESELEIKETIAKNVDNWANMWSKGDVKAYIAFYKPHYVPDETTTHRQWLANRKLRISPSRNIQVKLSDIVITPDKNSSDTVRVTFKQNYQAKHYQDNTSKQLVWKKIGGKWFIEKEIVQ